MRIAVATVISPFIRGGAELHADNLIKALQAHGYGAELVSIPFRFWPSQQVLRSMAIWEQEDFTTFDCGKIDTVICLKFPAYYLNHPRKVVWLLHQHRSVYDLWDTAFDNGISQTDEGCYLKGIIHAKDSEALANVYKLYANSRRVADRLLYFNGVHSTPLYHPPPRAEQFYCADIMPYIFCPGRLEEHKRQYLLIRAMQYVRPPLAAIIAGSGAAHAALQHLIEALHLSNRVRLVGNISDAAMLAAYAQCLGIFFGPYDEDYGYIILEAMLAAKPVITCTDSGGPLEFVLNGDTGIIVDPHPEAIAIAIERLYNNLKTAQEMGDNALKHYRSLDISWETVIDHLLS